jgi:RimJ/RimL family protein N-acetyltransferase
MVAVLADPAMYAFIGGEPPTLDRLRARYAHQSAGTSPDGGQRWHNWILRERATGRAVGFVQATIEVATGVADVAWVVTPVSQGRGLGGEAAAAMVGRLRDSGAVTAVTAHVHPAHEASQGVCRAIGLTPTSLVVDGERCWRSPAGEPA